MKRTALAALFAMIAVIGVAIPAAGATGPFFIKATSANICVKVTPDRPGTFVIQGDYAGHDCRKMFFSRDGVVSGHPYGEIQTAGSLDMAAGTACSNVLLTHHGATGTIWVQYVAETGRQYIINRYCNGVLGGGTNCVAALSGDGHIRDGWTIEAVGTHGWFQRVNWILVSSAKQRNTRAGC